MEEVFVSKVIVDLTIHLADEATAKKITEDVREFILARLDDYSYDEFNYDAPEDNPEIYWSAETTHPFNPESHEVRG